LECFVCLYLIDDEDEKVSISDSSSTEADTDKYDDTDSEISEAEKWPAKNGDISVKVPPTTKRKIQKRFLNKYVNNITWIAKFKLLD